MTEDIITNRRVNKFVENLITLGKDIRFNNPETGHYIIVDEKEAEDFPSRFGMYTGVTSYGNSYIMWTDLPDNEEEIKEEDMDIVCLLFDHFDITIVEAEDMVAEKKQRNNQRKALMLTRRSGNGVTTVKETPKIEIK